MKLCRDIEQCCGCTACKNICPKEAISMVENEKGFLYPHIKEELCIDCGMCARVCPLNGERVGNLYEQAIFAVQVIDAEKRRESQSGGAFSCFAEKVLERGGLVYGVALDKELRAVYQRVEAKEDLFRLKGSKYVQADLEHTFKQIKKDLLEDREVLFSGTACYADGLRHYLQGINTEKLVLCDLVCHGVPSPKVYRDYLGYLERQTGKKVTAFDFRNKKVGGWHKHIESYVLESGDERISEQYKRLFSKDVCLRESCYVCHYADFQRVSDITLGDFWGIERVLPHWDDNSGVSLVMINSEKGEQLFASIKRDIFYKKVSPETCVQHNLVKPTQRSDATDAFWAEYPDKSFRYMIKKYSDEKETTGNYFVLNNWLNKINGGGSIARYFMDRGMYHIAICGDERNSQLLASELVKRGLDVAYFINVFGEYEKNMALGKPVYNIDNLTELLIEDIDAVAITNEQFCAEILQRLNECGVPVYKAVPLSFLTALEV